MPSAHERAVQIAARKFRSADAIKKKLIDEGYNEDAADAAVERLAEIHLVDDARLAESISRHYRDRGNRFIAQKLREKGVAEHATDAVAALDDEEVRAQAAAEKKMKALGQFEPRVRAQKLYAHLAQRGFSSAVVARVVRQLTRSEEA